MGKNRRGPLRKLWHYSRRDNVDSSYILELELIDGLGGVRDESLPVGFRVG